MSFDDIVRRGHAQQKAEADEILKRDGTGFGELSRPEQLRIVRLLDNVGCRCEGKTEGIANAKRKPYWDMMKRLGKEMK